MPVTVVKRFLTQKNESEYKNIFKQCFPTVSWRASVPFANTTPRDSIYAALGQRGQVIGFCMVHYEPPQKMKQGPGAYMYNLCVAPDYRRQGAGSDILRAVAHDHPRCYAHMDQTDDDRNHTFMTRLGWRRVGQVRQFFEYALIPKRATPDVHGLVAGEEPEFQPVEIPARQYDAENNVIYIDL
jgi:GNAT superfamily N-acetyltransferase